MKTGQYVIARRYITAALLICNSILLAPVLAEGKSYDVEVVVFTNLNSGDGGERWPALSPDSTEQQSRYSRDSYQQLSAANYQMNNVVGSLRRSAGYHVILHKAWRQRDSDTVVIPVNVADGKQQLSGEFSLSRKRYLHFDVDLVLAAANAGVTTSYMEPAATSPVYVLHEKRRIKKSRTLHYFDHPRFGVIATVTPYQSAEEIQEALDKEQTEAVLTEEPVAEEPLPDDDQLTR